MSSNLPNRTNRKPKFKVNDTFGQIFNNPKQFQLWKIIKVERHNYFGFAYTLAYKNNKLVVAECDLEKAMKFN